MHFIPLFCGFESRKLVKSYSQSRILKRMKNHVTPCREKKVVKATKHNEAPRSRRELDAGKKPINADYNRDSISRTKIRHRRIKAQASSRLELDHTAIHKSAHPLMEQPAPAIQPAQSPTRARNRKKA